MEQQQVVNGWEYGPDRFQLRGLVGQAVDRAEQLFADISVQVASFACNRISVPDCMVAEWNLADTRRAYLFGRSVSLHLLP